jgi:hypothetical protein
LKSTPSAIFSLQVQKEVDGGGKHEKRKGKKLKEKV